MALGRGFASGFLMGVQGANAGLGAYYKAKDREEEEKMKAELATIASEQPTQSQGFTADQGEQLRAAAESGQYDIGYDEAKQAYTVTPKAGGDAGVIAQQGVSDFLGRRTAGEVSSDQARNARTMAMAGVVKKYNPLQGIQMEQQAMQGQRESERFGREQKRWAQEDEDRAKSKEYEESRKGVFSGSRFGQNQQTYQKAVEDYQGKLAKYEADKAAGKTGEALGAAPVAPARPEYTIGDALADRASLIDHDAKYGKLDARSFGEFTDMLNKVQSEGYEKTLRLAQSGAGIQEVAKSFNATGKVQFDPANVLSDKMVKGKNGVETRVIQFKDGQGNTRTINTVAELDSLGKASDVFTRFYQGRQDARAETQLGYEGQRLQLAKDEKAETKKEKEAKAEAGAALFRERNPAATEAEITAVKKGILEATPSAKNYKVEMGDVASAFGTPALDASGKAVVDPLTGRQVVNRNVDQERTFFQWMKDNNITDTNRGLALYLGQRQGGGAATSFASEAEADKAAKEGKIKKGDRITIGGKVGTWQ